MLKNNNLHMKFILTQKCQKLKLAFNKLEKVINKIKIFDIDNEILFKLTLDNLLNEIKTAIEVIKEKDE